MRALTFDGIVRDAINRVESIRAEPFLISLLELPLHLLVLLEQTSQERLVLVLEVLFL